MAEPIEIPDSVLDAYGIAGAEIEALTGGRTNRTLWVRAGRDLVLQQLKDHPDLDLLGLMENLVRVTAHLGWKHDRHDGGPTWWPELVQTAGNRPFLVTDDGRIWRAFLYREGRIGRDRLADSILCGAAALFGRFAGATADIVDPPLMESRSAFHRLDVVKREFEARCEAADSPARDRVVEVLEEFDGIDARLQARIAADGLDDLAHRVVHNDTKLSNVLLDPVTDQPAAVLDFDLVMMGPIWHDVGDLVRSAAWHAGRDGRPGLTPDLFADLIRSYVAAAAGTVTAVELATFATAGPRLSYELGLRYLSDSMSPEPVLAVESPAVSLERGQTNVMLAHEMLNAYDALRFSVDDLIATASE